MLTPEIEKPERTQASINFRGVFAALANRSVRADLAAADACSGVTGGL